jgi:hypothetical protein
MRANGADEGELPILYYAEKALPWVSSLLLLHAIPYKSILLVRDPRDIFLSITAFDRKRGFPGFDRRATDDDWSFAKRFVDDCRVPFQIIRKEEANSENILLKYEVLALDLVNESRRLSQHLGVTFDVGIVEKQRSEFLHHMTSDTPRGSVERWRRELPPQFNEFFVSKLHEELRHFGYET